jgi:hypothetical protein
VKYAFFSGPRSFVVILDNPVEKDNPIELLMRFEDIGWKVTRVHLPIEQIQNQLASAGAPSPTQIQDNVKTESEKAKADPEYVSKVKLYDFKATYFNSVLDGRVPGVTFKLKNEGDKVLKRVEVTVYFKDSEGNVISEEAYNPVIVSEYSFGLASNKPLKPGYIWQIERGKFMTAKSVPSEWSDGNAEARITRVEVTEE